MATVLVVDDANIMRANIKKMLSHLGHHVVGEAANGADAIKQYKILKPELVTMDITMPNFEGIADGIEAVKHIIEADSQAKIIMVTSHGEQDKVIKAIQNGASNYILKPLQLEKLEETINKLLG